MGATAEHSDSIADYEELNIRTNVFHGAAQNGAIGLVNPFLGINLIRLGATDFEIGLLSSLPPLGATLSTLLGARWLAHVKNPRRLTTLLFFLARMAFLGYALIDLLPGKASPLLLVILIGLSSVPQAIANVSWQAIITGLLSPIVRARAMSRRTQAASLVGIVLTLLGGWWIGQDPGLNGYPELFLVAFLVAMVEVWLFTRLKGHPPVQTLPPNLLQASRRLWSHDSFRRYTLASLPFYLGWVMAWPIFLRYQVNVAHANNLWIGLLSATNGVFAAATIRLWGRIGDRISAAATLPIAICLLSFVPFVYALHPDLLGLLFSNVIGGAAGAGVNMLLLLRLMEVTPEGDRILGMGVANTLVGLASVVGPLLSTALTTFIPIPEIFWIPFALRFVGGLSFWAAMGREKPLIRSVGP